jgi:hypothetical protein
MNYDLWILVLTGITCPFVILGAVFAVLMYFKT